MEKQSTSPVMLYTEQTPNPETLKYVLNRKLLDGMGDFKSKALAEEWSPFATFLFSFPYVKSVYINTNYVTITKEFNYGWETIMLKLKEAIKSYVQEGKPIVQEGYKEAMDLIAKESLASEYEGDDAEIVHKIIELIDTYVKPAVESDGGNIEFKSFKDGVVTVIMQGACSGCPSSGVTLKTGIEGMLQRMIPEVKEVVSEMG